MLDTKEWSVLAFIFWLAISMGFGALLLWLCGLIEPFDIDYED